MQRLIAVEEEIGETRAGVYENGRLVELAIERWSEAESRAIEGELYLGRVKTVDKSLNAAFVDIGRGAPGFLPFGKAGRPKGLHEGAALPVRVAREAHAEKGPNLAIARLEEGEEIADLTAPAVIAPAGSLAARLVKAYGEAEAVWADEAEIDLQEEIDAALSPAAAIPGGGELYIEQTRALTAIDVDAASRTAQGGAQKLALALNTSAVKEAARQIRIRGLGGIVAIDLLAMRAQPDRKAVERALRQAFKPDRARVDVAPISQFGVIELARQRRTRSLGEILLDESGAPSTETAALNAVRTLVREGLADRRRKLKLRLAPDLSAWLDAAPYDWKSAVVERIGPRFETETDCDLPAGGYEAKTL